MKNKIFSNLNKKKKKIIIRTFLLSLFLFAINTYAWFIYIDKFDGNINANVISWDVTFYDDDADINSIALEIDELYPGMDLYNKKIMVSNSGDLKATFQYEVLSFTLLGQTYTAGERYTSSDLVNILSQSFPFKITFSKNKDELNSGGDNAKFEINVRWDFESNQEYYKINSFFEYSDSIDYYIYDDDYILDDDVTIENFNSKINSLYIESDEADTYWGSRASLYKIANPGSNCLSLELNLIVSQARE